MHTINTMNSGGSASCNEENRIHSMQGNHIVGVATASSGAQQVEMWCGRMEVGSATPAHRHDTEEVVHFLKGNGRAVVADREIRYQAGDTLILPAGELHQIFSKLRVNSSVPCRSAAP